MVRRRDEAVHSRELVPCAASPATHLQVMLCASCLGGLVARLSTADWLRAAAEVEAPCRWLQRQEQHSRVVNQRRCMVWSRAGGQSWRVVCRGGGGGWSGYESHLERLVGTHPGHEHPA